MTKKLGKGLEAIIKDYDSTNQTHYLQMSRYSIFEPEFHDEKKLKAVSLTDLQEEQ